MSPRLFQGYFNKSQEVKIKEKGYGCNIINNRFALGHFKNIGTKHISNPIYIYIYLNK